MCIASLLESGPTEVMFEGSDACCPIVLLIHKSFSIVLDAILKSGVFVSPGILGCGRVPQVRMDYSFIGDSFVLWRSSM